MFELHRKRFVELSDDYGNIIRCINYPQCTNTYFTEWDNYSCPECNAVFDVADDGDKIHYWWIEHGKVTKHGI